MSHTPGPWIADMDAREIHVDAVLRDMRVIAEVCRDDAEGSNTRLIAAAPELLEALKRTLVECGFNDPNDTDYESEFAGIVRAAIAKATGGSPDHRAK